MAAVSRGRVEKLYRTAKVKKSTPSSRKHHFEPFSQRVARLKIDPVRKSRRHDFQEEDLSTTTSYFKTAFDEWKDLNLSESFTDFSREVEPLCESLPQILHHGDRIMDLLVKYLEKGDALSLEPLLSLVSHFAHDLSIRFEKHFSRTVSTICQLAAIHPDVEVIEWSFTCLAWLFKYLSRLLVPDLRPLYDLMAPLLGKEHQKPFITRFAAEALSFLVRKAGSVYHRDRVPLRLIVGHALNDLNLSMDQPNGQLYQRGLMTLFTESIKGVQRGIYSSGHVIFQELLTQSFSIGDTDATEFENAPATQMLHGVLTALIHHTDSESFRPLLNVILTHAEECQSNPSNTKVSFAARLLFIVAGVRKGSRTDDWAPVLKVLAGFVRCVGQISDIVGPHALHEVQNAIALAFQTSPLDMIIPNIQILERFTADPWSNSFLAFCGFFAELGPERFQSLLLPHLQRYIATHWEQQGDELCLLLPQLAKEGSLMRSQLSCPPQWQKRAVRSFKDLSVDGEGTPHIEDLVHRCNGFLEVMRVSVIEAQVQNSIIDELLLELQHAVEPANRSSLVSKNSLSVGDGPKYIVESGHAASISSTLWPSLCSASTMYKDMPIFWEAVHGYLRQSAEQLDLQGPHMEDVAQAVMDCLGSPSHELRLHGLEILAFLYAKRNIPVPEALSTATLIESTPISLQNARQISMHVRRLAPSYRAITSDPWLSRAIPMFCFGLLHFKLSQVWDDACNALKEMCTSKEGEDVISKMAFDWLQGAELTGDPDEESPKQPVEGDKHHAHLTEFECSNLSKLLDLVKESTTALNDPTRQLENSFKAKHQRVSIRSPSDREKALRVLNVTPHIAEKRSRILVPVLLSWATNTNETVSTPEKNDPDMELDHSSAVTQQRWNRRDQKAMLNLFTQFTNPKVLYRQSDVHDALLVLLTNGDVEIQKAALKALLTWKHPNVNRYEADLMNLLDDARFREQISVFLDVGKDDSTFRDEHRSDLMPIILRLLYGRVVARAGSASGKRGQESKRKAVFVALTRFNDSDVRQFIKIALGPLGDVDLVQHGKPQEAVLARDLLDPRKQYGLLNFFEDMLDTLGTQLSPFVAQVVGPVLYCLIRSSRAVDSSTNDEDGASDNSQLSLLKLTRTVGLHCLNALFKSCPDFEWQPYVPIVYQEVVHPRLDKLPIETAQSVSGLLRLFATWSVSSKTAWILGYEDGILGKIAECLSVPSAKDEVKLTVLGIVDNMVGHATQDNADVVEDSPDSSTKSLLQKTAGVFLAHTGEILRGSSSKELLEAGIRTVAGLAPLFYEGTSSSTVKLLIEVAVFLLQQPSRRVNPRTKSMLLEILHHLVPQCGKDALLALGVFIPVCQLFGFFRDNNSRALLCEVLLDVAHQLQDAQIQEAAELCREINSVSRTRLDEPDFERRGQAFAVINEKKYKSFTLDQWRPLVYNMLYSIRDPEMTIRADAVFSLRRFVEVASDDRQLETAAANQAQPDGFKNLIHIAILAEIQRGVRELSELVRNEYLSVLAYIVERLPNWEPVEDMHVLLAGGDEEASFFTNVLHIQQHRRLRALRRLAQEARSGKLGSDNINQIFIPLIEHYVFDKAEDDANAHNLTAEAINTIAALSQWLEWPQYRTLLRRYSGYMQEKKDDEKAYSEKTVIRLIGAVIDALFHAGNARSQGNGTTVSADAPHTAVLADDKDMMDGVDDQLAVRQSKLSAALPTPNKLSEDLTSKFLPALMAYLHHKDESTVSLRVPVAVAIVKLLRILPTQEFVERLPPVLMDVCQILRSRAQDSRDMTRKTLAEIAALIGPPYFGFLLKQLRSTLQRGYQLHVLSFTLHSILLAMSPSLKAGDLDYCVSDIVTVIMDDTFGVTGQEKDAEDYISKMKEVKSSKSFDTMDLVAKITTIRHLADLVRPIQALLLEKLNLKMVEKIDNLLRRVRLGILQNGSVHDRDILVFCYEIIQEVYRSSGREATSQNKEDSRKTNRYLIVMKSANKSVNRGANTSYNYKMVRFALDLLRHILRKYEALQTPSNVAGFMPIIGDALVGGQEEVQMSAVRLLTTIIKVPLQQLDKDAPVYVAEAVKIIRGAESTNSELAQAALKLISAVLRERRNTAVREKDLAYLLQRLEPDLDEPDRQGSTFNFIKAVLDRKVIITEVYKVMDKVAAVMVQNHTRSARDSARSVWFQFIMNYPQGGKRFRSWLNFLRENLEYEHVEGRQSVMEALNLVLTKINDGLIQEIVKDVFVPVALVIVNDDSKDCRAMAGLLLKKVFERADGVSMKTFLAILRGWLVPEEEANDDTRSLALQCWTLYFDASREQSKDVEFVLEQLVKILDAPWEDQDDQHWVLLYYTLQTFSKLCEVLPERTYAANAEPLWKAVFRCLLYPHVWVKVSAAKLLGHFFEDIARTNAGQGLQATAPPGDSASAEASQLSGSGGLQLRSDDMLELTAASLRVLRSPSVTEELATQTVRNLAFLGRCFAANDIPWRQPNAAVDNDHEQAQGSPSSSEQDEETEPQPGTTRTAQTALAHLFARLAAILRREPVSTAAQSLHGKTAALRLLTTLSTALPASSLTPSLETVLLPLHNLTDKSIPAPHSPDPAFNAAYAALRAGSEELMGVLRTKVGTGVFVAALQRVEQGVRARKEGRREKRRVERVMEPEKVGREKRRRLEGKKERRRERGWEMRGRRRGW